MNRRRKISNRLICGVLALALVLSATPLSKRAEAAKKPKLSKTSAKLYVGKKVKLKVKNFKKKVKWSSNKKKIATVSKKGVVTAKKTGTAKITARAGKKKLVCKVKVLAKKKKTTPKPQKPSVPNITVTEKPDNGNIPEETPTGEATTTAIPWKTPKPDDTSSDMPWKSSRPDQTPSSSGPIEIPAVSATPAPTLPTGDTGLTGEEQRKCQQAALNGVNGKREEAGLPEMALDEGLNYAAYLMAKEYATQYWVSEETKQSAMASMGVDYEDYSISIDGWKSTYDDVLKNWMENEDYKSAILSESYNKTGIAVVNNGETNFWVQVFVKDISGSKPTPTGEPSPGPLQTPINTASPSVTAVPSPSPSVTSNPTAAPSPTSTTKPTEQPTVTPTTPKPATPTPKETVTPTTPKPATPTPKETVTPTTPKPATPTPKETVTPKPATPTPVPTPLTNPAKIILAGSGQSWNAFQTADTKVSVTGSVSVQITCTGISNAEIWYVCIPQLLPKEAFTSQEGVAFSNSIWASGGTCLNGGTVTVPNGMSPAYVYVRVHDKSTGFIYYLSSAGIEVSVAATPTPKPTATPIATPTPSTGTGTAGTNVNLNGKTAFTVGGYQLAIGLTKSEVNTVLGSLSVDVKREEKSPQGFDVIAFRPNGNDSSADYDDKFSTYVLIYLKNNMVVGITAIAPTVNYGNAISVGTAESTLQSNGWSAVSWYDTTDSHASAYSKNINGTNVIGFIDYYGNKNVYCIQAFSSDYSVEDMTDPSKTNCTLNYSDTINTVLSTETGEMLNAYLVMHADRGALRINTKLAGVATAYSKTIADNGATDAGQVARSSASIKSALSAAGITSNSWGEHILIGNMDAVGFANSIIESEQGRARLHNSDFSMMGVGVNASSSGGTYYPNMVIDFTAFISTM